MKDEDLKHLTDLETALDALGPELEAGPLTDDHAFAAVRARLVLIANLVQTLPTALH